MNRAFSSFFPSIRSPQKQQNSLIAGLRATNEAMMRQDPSIACLAISGEVETAGATNNGSVDKKDSSIECFDPLQADYAKESMSAASLNVASIQPSTSSSSSHPPLPTTSSHHSTQRTENCTQRNSSATQANDPLRLRKKSQNILNRSDSTGSTSGRKFLAPTLSDPQAMRNEKYSQKKKTGTFSSLSSSTSTAVSSTPIASTKTSFRKCLLV